MALMTDVNLGPWQQIARGIYRLTAQPEGVTVGLIIGAERALLVDTGSSPAQGRAIRRHVTALTDVPLAHVVVTHAHDDHAYGLAAFTDLETIGQEGVADALHGEAAAAAATRLGIDPDELAVPSTLIAILAARDLGDRRVEIIHFGPGHTGCDLAVFVPDAGVMFVGDLIEESGPPQIDADSRLAAWPATLDGVLGSLQADSVVVPGHGAVVDRTFCFLQRADIAAIYGQAEWLCQRGVGLDSAFEHPEVEWPFDRATIEVALPLAYAELAAKGITPRPRLPLA